MREPLRLFLCGDVMTGRGIDQVMPHPSDPTLHEPYVADARRYVDLAESVNGPIPRPVDFAYVWGDALAELERHAPALRIINLETAITRSDGYWPDKGIHYRMHPDNVPCLDAAGIDCCSLANNHVLDWGYAGLSETLSTLRQHGIAAAGAGATPAGARAPARLPFGSGHRVLVFAVAAASSGAPPSWRASRAHPGIEVTDTLDDDTARALAQRVHAAKTPGDVAVVSVHWGGNWGYEIPDAHRRFAHTLIDHGSVDIVHGHSSHHVKGIEVFGGRLILYGCGDLINDYEGIGGYESFRDDLSLMYFPELDPQTGALTALAMVPMQVRRFQLVRAAAPDQAWLCEVLNQQGAELGSGAELRDGRLDLLW